MLVDPACHHVVMAFALRPRAVAEVARELRHPIGRVHRWVVRATQLGLLRVAATLPRTGRAIRLYQTTSTRFLVPDEMLRKTPGEALSEEMRDLLAAHRLRSGGGHAVTVDPTGRLWIEPLVDRAGPVEIWRRVWLTPQQARRLEAEIRDLISRYDAAGGQGPEHLVHVAIAERAAKAAKSR